MQLTMVSNHYWCIKTYYPYQTIMAVQLFPNSLHSVHTIIIVPLSHLTMDICAIRLIMLASIKTHPCVTNRKWMMNKYTNIAHFYAIRKRKRNLYDIYVDQSNLVFLG